MCLTGLKRTNIKSSIRLEVVSKLPMRRSLLDAMRMIENIKAWFSLAHKHRDIRKRRMAYLAQFSIPALRNPMIRRTKRPPYCFWYVRMRSWSMWPMIGPRPRAYACAYVDPVLPCLHIKHELRQRLLHKFLDPASILYALTFYCIIGILKRETYVILFSFSFLR